MGGIVDDRRRVAERLEAGMAQRAAYLAAVEEGGAFGSAELEEALHVEEPVPVSGRPGLGRVIVFTRKAIYHLLLKWCFQGILQQQNTFNRAVARHMQELGEEVRRLRDRLDAADQEGDDA
jgi:hypothetical protein